MTIPHDTDAVLLAAWRSRLDQDSFQDLCARHVNLVVATSRRLGSPDADEAAQAVFLVLARRAGTIDGPGLANWLYGTTRRVVANQIRAAVNRCRHEREAAMEIVRHQTATAPAKPTWVDAREHLDAALASLSSGRREAVLRFYLEGKSQAEIAAELGCSEGAVKTRVHEGLEHLRSFFSRRGVGLGAAALAAGLTGESAAVEPTLAATCAQAAYSPATVPTAAALASGVITTMAIKTAIFIAAAILLVGSLIGVGVLAADQTPRPVPPTANPPVVPIAPTVPVDQRLAQSVTAVLTGRGILPAVRQLNCLLRERFDVVVPQYLYPLESDASLDGPVKTPYLTVVLPPGSTAATALDGIAEQSGCTWRMAEGLVCFEDRVQHLDPLGATWDVLDVHRALTQGDAATVGRGIAAWLELPQRRPIQPLLIHPRSWLGRVALLGDARLAERFRQACPEFPGARNYFDDVMLGDPRPADRLGGPAGPAELTRLILAAMTDPQDEEAGIAAVDVLLSSPDPGPLAGYEARLVEIPSANGALTPFPRFFRLMRGTQGCMSSIGGGPDNLSEALTRLLIVRGDGELRCRLLDSGVLQRFGAGMAGSGRHPAWHHRLAEALRAGEEDSTRLLAERILASSADPENWTRLLECWRTSYGGARKRLTWLIMGAGQRGCDAILTALSDGSLPVDVLTGCLEVEDSDVPVPLIGLCATVAGSPTWPDSLRQAAVLRICAAHAHPLIAQAATALIEEGSKGSRSLLVGLGLRLKFSQGLVADGDSDVARALRSSSSYLRAVALAIEDKRLTGARERSKVMARRDMVRRFPGADPSFALWPKTYSHGALAHYLPPDPGRAAAMLTMARNDPSPQVRLRAAAIGLRLLPEAEAPEVLRALAIQEKDPAVRKRLDDRSPTRTVEEDNTVTTTWEDLEILNYGGPGFPEWRDCNDNELVPLKDADQERILPGSIKVIEEGATTQPMERLTRTY